VDDRRLDAAVGRLPRGHLPHHLQALSRLHRLAGLAAVAVTLTTTAAPQAADLEAGRRKAEPCVPCHGTDGNATIPGTPSLAGQPAWFTHWTLFKFRDGRRKDPLMSPFAANLSDADMADLAAYYEAQRSRPRPQVVDTAKAALGKGLASVHLCTSCHRPDLSGQHQVPRLAGQDLEYLLKLLRAYKAQTAGDLEGLMTQAAQPLSAADIENLAHFMAISPAAPAP
jgi:cytochrome c553